jgi:hypothetical protein
MEETTKPRSCADYGIRLTALEDGGVLIEGPTPIRLDLEGAQAFEDEFAAAFGAARKMFCGTIDLTKVPRPTK